MITQINNVSINIVTTASVCCLFIGVPELTSTLYNISYFIHNSNYLKDRFQKTNILIRLLFCFSFLIIRVFWWSSVGPYVVYQAYINDGYKIILITYPIFQSMQYYWGLTIIKKIYKYFKISEGKNKCLSEY